MTLSSCKTYFAALYHSIILHVVYALCCSSQIEDLEEDIFSENSEECLLPEDFDLALDLPDNFSASQDKTEAIEELNQDIATSQRMEPQLPSDQVISMHTLNTNANQFTWLLDNPCREYLVGHQRTPSHPDSQVYSSAAMRT